MKSIISILVLLKLLFSATSAQSFEGLFGEKKPLIQYNQKEISKEESCDPCGIHTTKLPLKQTAKNILQDLQFNGSEWECIKNILERKHFENETDLLIFTISKTISHDISNCYQEKEKGLWERFQNWWTQTDFIDIIKKYWFHTAASIIAAIIFLFFVFKLIWVIKICSKKHNDDDII